MTNDVFDLLIVKGDSKITDRAFQLLSGNRSWGSVRPESDSIKRFLEQNRKLKLVIIAGGERGRVDTLIKYLRGATPGTQVFVLTSELENFIELVARFPAVKFFDCNDHPPLSNWYSIAQLTKQVQVALYAR